MYTMADVPWQVAMGKSGTTTPHLASGEPNLSRMSTVSLMPLQGEEDRLSIWLSVNEDKAYQSTDILEAVF